MTLVNDTLTVPELSRQAGDHMWRHFPTCRSERRKRSE